MRVDGKCKAGTMTAPMQNTPGRIFISYRREETSFAAGWLFDVLAEHFDREQIPRQLSGETQ